MSYKEKRAAPRFRVNVDVQWESATVQRRGTISDISTSGCFMLTAPEIKAKEPVKVGIELPSGKGITLTGETVYAVEEIGFALRFTNLAEPEQQFLQRLVDSARRKQAQ